MLGGTEAGLARIETLKASSSEAPTAPRIEIPKASRGRGMGRGVPLLSRLGGLGSVVSSPSGVRGAKKRILVYFEVERTHLVTTNLFFLTLYVTQKLP